MQDPVLFWNAVALEANRLDHTDGIQPKTDGMQPENQKDLNNVGGKFWILGLKTEGC